MADSEPTGMTGGAAELLRRVSELRSQVTRTARAFGEEIAGSPATRMFAPMADLNARMIELATAWVEPVRASLEEQQQLIDALAAWAEQQRVLADRFSELAERHRKLTFQSSQLIGTLLDETERLRDRAKPTDDVVAESD